MSDEQKNIGRDGLRSVPLGQVFHQDELDEVYEAYRKAKESGESEIEAMVTVLKPLKSKLEERAGTEWDLHYLAYFMQHTFSKLEAGQSL